MASLLARLNATPLRRWSVVAGVFVGMGLGYYHLQLFFGDSFSRGSYPYYLLIGDFVGSLPAFEPIYEPSYSAELWTDAPVAWSEESMRYCTFASHVRVTSFYTAHFAKLGFKIDEQTETAVHWSRAEQRVGLSLHPDYPCMHVYVRLFK